MNRKLKNLKSKYTHTIKKDNNHIYCEIKNYKKILKKLRKLKGKKGNYYENKNNRNTRTSTGNG